MGEGWGKGGGGDPDAMMSTARHDVDVYLALGPPPTRSVAPRRRGLTGERYWRDLEPGVVGIMRACGRPTVDGRHWREPSEACVRRERYRMFPGIECSLAGTLRSEPLRFMKHRAVLQSCITDMQDLRMVFNSGVYYTVSPEYPDSGKNHNYS